MSVWSSIKEFFAVEAPEVRTERLARLAELKTIVARHVADYPTVGAALAEIHSRELYKLEHATFEDFVKAEWNMSRQHADRLIKAAETARILSPTGSVPKTERLARPIAALPEAQQLATWQDARDLAGGEEVKPEHVAQAVAKRKPVSNTKRRAKPIRLRVPGANVTIEPTKAFTTAEDALTFALQQLRSKAAA